MLLTIISTVLGILSSSIPNLLRIWERRNEARYELELTKLRLEGLKAGLDVSKDIEDIKALVREGESTRSHDSVLDGGEFINKLRASVRPVITYTFFLFFIFVKLTAFVLVISQGLTVENLNLAMATIFDDTTVAVFSTILGFWFGARALEKFSEAQKVIYINKDDSTPVESTKRRK